MNIEAYVCQFCGKDMLWNADTGEYVGDCDCRVESDPDGIMEHIEKRVGAWDHEHIEDLQSIIAEIPKDLKSDPKFYGVDMTDLPSEPMPDDIDTSYPVWSIDKNGYCLVGDTADRITHINQIREYYRHIKQDQEA